MKCKEIYRILIIYHKRGNKFCTNVWVIGWSILSGVCHKDICILSLRSSNHLYLIIMQHGNVSLFFHSYFYVILFSLDVSCLFIIRNIIIRGWYKYYCIIIICDGVSRIVGISQLLLRNIFNLLVMPTQSTNDFVVCIIVLLMMYHAVFPRCIWEKKIIIF